jgi:hypothetical protein
LFILTLSFVMQQIVWYFRIVNCSVKVIEVVFFLLL